MKAKILENQAVCSERQPQVTEYLDKVKTTIYTTEEVSQVLRDKIQPVLRMSEPLIDENAQQPVEQLVPLAEELRSFYHQLMQINANITQMLDLLEL